MISPAGCTAASAPTRADVPRRLATIGLAAAPSANRSLKDVQSLLCRPLDYADHWLKTGSGGGDRCDGVGIITVPPEMREACRSVESDREWVFAICLWPTAEERSAPLGARYFLSGEAPARLSPDRDELVPPGPAGRARGEGPEVVEHEQADRRRQGARLAGRVDLADQLGQGHGALVGNLLHAIPERLFEADAGLVTRAHDRALHDW